MTKPTDDSIIAFCYLENEGDEQNKCLLSETALHIKQKGITSSLLLGWIQQVSFKRKKYLLPIVLGGIIAPLAGLGLFQYYLNPWLMMGIMLIAILAIYYGYEGGVALCIETPVKEYDFFVATVSPNLKAFAAFVQQKIKGIDIKYYIKLGMEDIAELQQNGHLKLPEAGLRVYLQNEINSSELQNYFEMNFEKMATEMRYIKSDYGQLTPFIFGELPVSQVIISSHSD